MNLYLFHGEIFGNPRVCVAWAEDEEKALSSIQGVSPNFVCEPEATPDSFHAVIPLVDGDTDYAIPPTHPIIVLG